MYVCMYVCMYVYVYVCMYVCMHVCVCVCVCMYVCMYSYFFIVVGIYCIILYYITILQMLKAYPAPYGLSTSAYLITF